LQLVWHALGRRCFCCARGFSHQLLANWGASRQQLGPERSAHPRSLHYLRAARTASRCRHAVVAVHRTVSRAGLGALSESIGAAGRRCCYNRHNLWLLTAPSNLPAVRPATSSQPFSAQGPLVPAGAGAAPARCNPHGHAPKHQPAAPPPGKGGAVRTPPLPLLLVRRDTRGRPATALACAVQSHPADNRDKICAPPLASLEGWCGRRLHRQPAAAGTCAQRCSTISTQQCAACLMGAAALQAPQPSPPRCHCCRRRPPGRPVQPPGHLGATWPGTSTAALGRAVPAPPCLPPQQQPAHWPHAAQLLHRSTPHATSQRAPALQSLHRRQPGSPRAALQPYSRQYLSTRAAQGPNSVPNPPGPAAQRHSLGGGSRAALNRAPQLRGLHAARAHGLHVRAQLVPNATNRQRLPCQVPRLCTQTAQAPRRATRATSLLGRASSAQQGRSQQLASSSFLGIKTCRQLIKGTSLDKCGPGRQPRQRSSNQAGLAGTGPRDWDAAACLALGWPDNVYESSAAWCGTVWGRARAAAAGTACLKSGPCVCEAAAAARPGPRRPGFCGAGALVHLVPGGASSWGGQRAESHVVLAAPPACVLLAASPARAHSRLVWPVGPGMLSVAVQPC
jgi:hypothetical protein